MKHYQRALVTLYSFITAVLSLFVVLVLLGWTQPLEYLQDLLAQQETRWTIVAVAAVVFLLAVKLLIDSLRPETTSHAPIITTELGQVSISVSTLENMVKKSVNAMKGVHQIRPQIKNTSEGVAIFLKVQLAPDMVIPDTTSQIQSSIRDYFETYAGLKVVEVRILVEDAPQEIKSRVE